MNTNTNVIEALLFLENSLVSMQKLARAIDISQNEIEPLINEINKKYSESGSIFFISKLEDSYKLSIKESFAHPALEKYAGKKRKISGALLETLAIVAYKQPATSGEISDIRGVNSSNYIKILLDDDFVKIAGKKDVPGKPFMYKTTPKFLTHFGLKNLSELPTAKEIKTFDFLNDNNDDE